MFAGDIPLYTKLDFYRTFGDLMLAYAKDDRELLIELVGEEISGSSESPVTSEEALVHV